MTGSNFTHGADHDFKDTAKKIDLLTTRSTVRLDLRPAPMRTFVDQIEQGCNPFTVNRRPRNRLSNLLRLSILSTFLFLCTSLPADSHAFNQDECGNLFPKIADRHPPYFSPLYTVTMVPSTTSYMSSWGKCSMYGAAPSVQRKRFVAETYEVLSREAARGAGEYVYALAELSGCPASHRQDFAKALQGKFSDIFSDSVAGGSDSFDRKIDAMIDSNSTLGQNCRIYALSEK